MASVYPAGRIDQKSDQGKALQQVIQAKLKDFLGKEYADDVLPLYIVVMLAHGNEADLVADNLEAFLGKAYADQFTQWCACTNPPNAILPGTFMTQPCLHCQAVCTFVRSW